MSSAARENKSTSVSFDLSNPIAEGGFRVVYGGTYTEGSRCGQPCVVKYFKPKYEAYSDRFFTYDIMQIHRCLDIVEKWNQLWEGTGAMKPIYVNQAEIITDSKERKCLLEPYINNYAKWNSNTGWVNPEDSHWNDRCQALSHFSYHVSAGQFLLCDLQGGTFNKGLALTDVIVMSAKRQYGLSDLGREGMVTFMSRHQCNTYCQDHWQRPKESKVYYKAQQGTSMEYEINNNNKAVVKYTESERTHRTDYETTMQIWDCASDDDDEIDDFYN